MQLDSRSRAAPGGFAAAPGVFRALAAVALSALAVPAHADPAPSAPAAVADGPAGPAGPAGNDGATAGAADTTGSAGSGLAAAELAGAGELTALGADPAWVAGACRLRGAGDAGCPDGDESLRELRELGAASLVRGREADHMVAFTFDDGPRLATTPRVLAALDRYDVPATFFVVGRRLIGVREATRKRVALLREIRARGHLVGNHTVNHARLTELTPAEIRREIDVNTLAIESALGYVPHLFRPPYGAIGAHARAHLAREGFTEVRWAIDTGDFFTGAGPLRKKTVRMILERDGGVVLMHDTKGSTADSIAGILDDLERENCRRLAAGGPVIVPVSLHYFIREPDGSPRPIPAAVAARTQRWRDRLPARCQARRR